VKRKADARRECRGITLKPKRREEKTGAVGKRGMPVSDICDAFQHSGPE
jgi:hypothetical protein